MRNSLKINDFGSSDQADTPFRVARALFLVAKIAWERTNKSPNEFEMSLSMPIPDL